MSSSSRNSCCSRRGSSGGGGGFAFIHLCRWRQLLIRQKVEDRVTQREGGKRIRFHSTFRQTRPNLVLSWELQCPCFYTSHVVATIGKKCTIQLSKIFCTPPLNQIIPLVKRRFSCAWSRLILLKIKAETARVKLLQHTAASHSSMSLWCCITQAITIYNTAFPFNVMCQISDLTNSTVLQRLQMEDSLPAFIKWEVS